MLQRVQVARLPVRYAWAMRWYEFQDQAAREKLAWPGPAELRAELPDVSRYRQSLRRDPYFGRQSADDLRTAHPSAWDAPILLRLPAAKHLPRDQWIDLQDATFNLASEGNWVTLEKDDLASDKTAARMPGNHHQWAVQQQLLGKPLVADATYDVFASIRVEKTGNAGGAFSAGIYDMKNRVGLGQVDRTCADVADDQYHVYQLGSTKLHGEVYFWAAPADNPGPGTARLGRPVLAGEEKIGAAESRGSLR